MFVQCDKCGKIVDVRSAKIHTNPLAWLCAECDAEEVSDNLPPHHIVEVLTIRRTRYADGTVKEEVL